LNSSSAIFFGRPHWCSCKLRADHDHRTPGVVDALPEQVLAEAALLALEHIAQRLEGAVARTADRPAAPSVVEQCIDRFLQHALLVADDDLGCIQVQQRLSRLLRLITRR
jgi:hypothetical protein